MKVLVFHIGSDRYGLRLGAIARVVPVAGLKALPLAPAFIAGILDLHGDPVPVIDLSQLAGTPAQQLWFDTRILLLDYAADGATRQLGLLAEHVSGVENVDDASLQDTGVAGARFLGRVASGEQGMLQLVEPAGLLPPEVRELLFAQPEAAS